MENTKTGFSGKFLGFLAALIGISWALIEYIFPDPLLYLYRIWRPEYVLVFIAILTFLLSSFIYTWSYIKNKYLFFFCSLVIYSFSCFVFFAMGEEFYNTQFTDELPTETAQMGSVYYRGIEFEHKQCDRKADTINCKILVINKRGEQSTYTQDWALYMKNGAVFNDYKIFRGGQELRRNHRLDLPQGVEAKIDVIFYEVPNKYNEILKLGFETKNKKYGFKHITIKSS